MEKSPTAKRTCRPSSADTSTLTAADQAFLETLTSLNSTANMKGQKMTAAEYFCMRLADGLDRLPSAIRNQLELEFLQKLTKAENEYCIE